MKFRREKFPLPAELFLLGCVFIEKEDFLKKLLTFVEMDRKTFDIFVHNR